MNGFDIVQSRLQAMQPASVYALNDRALQLVSGVLPSTPIGSSEKPLGAPCSVALGIHALDGLSADQARQMINQTRLYVSPRLLLVERTDCALDPDAFRALGFVLHASDTAAKLNIYDYDLDTYKPVPDWLNARFWAHPERWSP